MDKIIEQVSHPYLEYDSNLTSKMSDEELKYFKDHFICVTIYEDSDGKHYCGLSSYDSSQTITSHDLTKFRFGLP